MKIIMTFDWLSKWVENKFHDSMRFIDIATIEGGCVATANATLFIFLLPFFTNSNADDIYRFWQLQKRRTKFNNRTKTVALCFCFLCCCLLFLCCRLFLCANSIFFWRWRHNTKMKPSRVGQKEMENTEKRGKTRQKTKKMQQKQKILFECSKRQQ